MPDQIGSGTPPLAETAIENALVAYFSSPLWREFIQRLESGPHIRHAHIYAQSQFDPRVVALFLTHYFKTFGRPLQRRIKILPITDDVMDVYNVHPAGHSHWELFLNWAPGTLLQPHPAHGRSGTLAFEFWDDAHMANFYEKFSFRSLGAPERRDADTYFRSKAWTDNLLINIDDFGGVIHSHALVNCSLHPEQLLEIGAEHFARRGWTVDKQLSIVFNVYGMEMGKLTYLLREPEIVIELEWHFDPDVIIEAASIPHYRVATASRLNDLLGTRPYVTFGQDIMERTLARLSYPE